MRESVPSRTAFRAALRRATHQLRDEPRVLEDPFALRIIGPAAEKRLRSASHRWESGLAQTVRALMVVRTRFCEDRLAEAVAAGVRQFVILGAGLDTFSLRNPFQGLRVFEIDHPASQMWKRTLLERAGISVPVSVTFVPLDLMASSWAASLREAGWDDSQPTFISCLGVSSYLPKAVFREMLRSVSALPHGSAIVFDVSTPADRVSLFDRMLRAVVRIKVAIEGEPLMSRFDPGVLATELQGMGFEDVERLDAVALNVRYLADRRDKLRIAERSALLRAVV